MLTAFGSLLLPSHPDARLATISRYAHTATQRSLLRHLAGGNDGPTRKITAPGWDKKIRYTPAAIEEKPLEGTILFLSPHPSDVTADFFASLIHQLHRSDECVLTQLLLTRGEKGNPEQSDRDTITQRIDEEAISAKRINMNVEYAVRRPGEHSFYNDRYYFPDGQLIDHIDELTAYLKERFRRQFMQANGPHRLALPSIYPDHPDHLATTMAAIKALEELAQEKSPFAEDFFTQYGKIEILTSDGEFGLRNGLAWARDEIARYQKTTDSKLPAERFQLWHNPSTGYSALAAGPSAEYPVYLGQPETMLTHPPLMLAASEEDARYRMEGLRAHASQGREAYFDLIPLLDGIRARQLGREISDKLPSASGFFPLYIPGVTHADSSLIHSLPKDRLFRQSGLAANVSQSATQHNQALCFGR